MTWAINWLWPIVTLFNRNARQLIAKNENYLPASILNLNGCNLFTLVFSISNRPMQLKLVAYLAKQLSEFIISLIQKEP